MKIFQIGFNKGGTRSMCAYFRKNGINSVHYSCNGHCIAIKMMSNLSSRLPILDGIDNHQFYSDMEYVAEDEIIEGYAFFKELDLHYPNSIFILNLRNKNNWLKSRSNHPGPKNPGNYIRKWQAYYGMTKHEVIDRWSSDWDRHLAEVRSYFKGNDRFFEFDIERDDVSELSNFLIGHGLDIKHHTFPKIS